MFATQGNGDAPMTAVADAPPHGAVDQRVQLLFVAAPAAIAGLFAVFVATILACGVWFLRSHLVVDDCLDRGGCWDTLENRCEFADSSACQVE